MNTSHVRTAWTLLLPLVLIACAKAPEVEPEPPRLVRSTVIYAEGGGRVRTFSGIARAAVESRLSFKVSGTVDRVAVAVGDRVREGDLIASLETTDLQLRVEDARANLLRQQASARNAQAAYRRTEALYENNNASLAELEAARAADETAQAAVASAQKSLELAQTQVSYATLRAPVDGSVSAVDIEEGENVQPGAPVVTITAGTRIEVEVSVPGVLINRVREGQAVQARFEALAGRSYAAKVTEVGVSSVASAGAYPVRVRLEEATDEVRPGMAAEVDITFASTGASQRIVVPPTAVAEDIDGRFVCKLTPEEDHYVVHRAPVRVGDLTFEGLEILEGVADGDRLATAGVDRLLEGETVGLWHPVGAQP